MEFTSFIDGPLREALPKLQTNFHSDHAAQFWNRLCTAIYLLFVPYERPLYHSCGSYVRYELARHISHRIGDILTTQG